MNPLEVWRECVESAKDFYGKKGYQLLRGKILKRAQTAYCAIMVSKLKG